MKLCRLGAYKVKSCQSKLCGGETVLVFLCKLWSGQGGNEKSTVNSTEGRINPLWREDSWAVILAGKEWKSEFSHFSPIKPCCLNISSSWHRLFIEPNLVEKSVLALLSPKELLDYNIFCRLRHVLMLALCKSSSKNYWKGKTPSWATLFQRDRHKYPTANWVPAASHDAWYGLASSREYLSLFPRQHVA